jgi:hypothetical protein
MARAHAAIMILGAMMMLDPPATAELIEFTFEGELFQVLGEPLPPWEDVEVGSSYTVSYVFDSETPDESDLEHIGLYFFEYADITLDDATIRGETVWLRLDLEYLWLFDNYHVTFTDFPTGWSGGTIDLIGPNDLFETDALPLDLDLDAFTGQQAFEFIGPGFELRGNIQTFSRRIVPGPSALVVLLIGGFMHRRRSRTTSCVDLSTF